MINILVCSVLLLQTQVDYYSFKAVKHRFADAWNRCVIKQETGVTDLKLCKEVNKKWLEVYNHEEWPK